MEQTPIFHPNRRSFLLRSGVAATVWGAATGVSGQNAGMAMTGVRVALGVPQSASLSCLPVMLAHELGFFRAEGLLLDWVTLASEAAGMQALAKGQIHLLSCDFAHTLMPRPAGTELKAFVLQTRTPQMVFGVLPRALAGYRQFSDLKGHRVCTLPHSAASQLVIHRLMQDAGLHGLELSVVSFAKPDDVLDLMRSGNLDAFCMDHTMVAVLEQRGEVRVVADTRTLKGTLDVFGGPMPGAVVCASSAYVQQHPEICQAATHAVVRALKWLRTAGPSDLVRALASVPLDADRANYVAALEKSRDGFTGDGVLSDASVATALAAVNRLDTRARLNRAQLIQAYTNEFALKAKVRYRL